MKSALHLILVYTLFFSLISCSKNDDNDPVPPHQNTSTALIEQVVYRHLVDNSMVEEIYSLKYDSQNRLTETKRVDKNMLLTRFQYSGNQLSSIVVYNTAGNIGATYVSNQSLFLSKDTVSFYHTVDLSPAPELDTVFQVFLFNDSILQKGTYTMGSAFEDLRSSYSGLIYEYNTQGNVEELGYTNTNQQYIVHMNVTGVDNKKNPFRDAGPLAFIFFYVIMDSELTMSVNNITDIQYGNGGIAELEYTYNDDGYPLTVKNKSEDFLKYEFTYKLQ